jgi:dsRNA-specific ribonuclease
LNSIYDHFLQNFVYSNYGTQNLIWNPFTCEFLLFKDRSENQIQDQIRNTTFLSFFEKAHNISLSLKTGQVLFKAIVTEEIVSSLKKFFNKIYSSIQQPNEQLSKSLMYSICDQFDSFNSEEGEKSQDPKKVCGFNDFKIETDRISVDNATNSAECKIKGKDSLGESPLDPTSDFISNVSSNHSDVLINCALNSVKSLSIYSAECCFITPLKKSILVETQLFKRNYKLIEDLFISLELKEAFGLNIDLLSIIQSFTQKSENSTFNYERLEFLGDCVLKFLSTNHLYLENYDIDKIVSFKDTIVCNANLFNCCVSSGIFRYLKTSRFNPKMIQAPCVSDSNDLMNYFQAHSIFKSNNHVHFATKAFDPDEVAIKMYADMIEALIGSLFLENGIEDAFSFINRLGIIRSGNSNTDDSVLTENFLKSLMDHSTVEDKEVIKPKQISLDSLINKNIKQVISHLNNQDMQFPGSNLFNKVCELPTSLKIDNVNVNLQNTLFNERRKIEKRSSVFYGSEYFLYEYQGFVNKSEIEKLEEVIGYKFSNVGNIERAMMRVTIK